MLAYSILCSNAFWKSCLNRLSCKLSAVTGKIAFRAKVFRIFAICNQALSSIPPVTRNVQDYQDAFDWVYRIEDATKDYYRESAEATQEKLKKDYSIDTVLVEVQDDKLMETKYALARDVDPGRTMNQIIEQGKCITTHTDEVLTSPEPGETAFDGVHEVLDREENESEDYDRKWP
jgi:hypothetical protein